MLAALVLLLLGSARPAAADIITVTGTGDIVASDGQCTLREAILAANSPNTAVNEASRAAAGIDEIRFNMTTGSAPYVISIVGNLPAITDPVLIEGLSQGGIACPVPMGALAIQIANMAAVGNGLRLDPGSDGSTIRGFSITGFSGVGVRMAGTGSRVTCGYVGVAANGSTAGGPASPAGPGGHGANRGGGWLRLLANLRGEWPDRVLRPAERRHARVSSDAWVDKEQEIW